MIEKDVMNPPHYRRFVIEPIDFILKNGLGYAEGNIIKYVCRWQHKNGVEDLIKARSYLDKLIAHEKSKEPQGQVLTGSMVVDTTPALKERFRPISILGPYASREEREERDREWDPQP